MVMILGRRDLLATLLSVAGLPFLAGCGRSHGRQPATPGDALALALLDQIAEDLLRLFPETATSLGIDTGSRGALKSQLADRSADGVQRVANHVRGALERINALPT